MRAADRVTGDDDPVRGKKLLHSIAGDENAVGLFAQQDIAFPCKGIAFMDKLGMPFACAARSTGKLEYPPTPITASGRKLRRMRLTWKKLRISLNGNPGIF